ncbi:MAG: HesA/MoeB/ThiF family protein [Desulfatiglans sp.]|jgi:adenylyltransferase/sulfurtransferase|nr:HesA/MoeB/ThiF family protein [Desulfatiglans sp.]
MLSLDELNRYDRQIMVPEIGLEGQEKIKSSRVFIAGAGGLGSPVSLYLAAAGVGTLVIADNDRVEITNLNRQILHWPRNIGSKKVESAREKINSFNEHTKVEIFDETIDDDNISGLTNGCDVIIDAMDNIATRFVLNRAAIKRKIPFIHGAVSGLEGRVTTIIPFKTACIGCMYRADTKPGKFPVLGVTPGIIGIIQATEVIKYLTGMGELLTNRLLIYDGMDLSFREFKLSRNPECRECNTGKV